VNQKITEEHLRRRAIVYVRQSTPIQLIQNRESQIRQYGLAEHARNLGFADVETIDADLGRSGSGLEERPGFQRLVAEVCAGQVGAILCIEASRLARNGRDWHQLFELCGLVGYWKLDEASGTLTIKAGHNLIVNDVRREAAAPHLSLGAKWAASPRDVARESELILTSLPGPKEVEAVALGADGIIHGVIPGTIFADLSTGSPTMMRRLHAAFQDKGVHVLDSPVSGGVWGAQRGSLQVMVGGDEGIYNEVKGVLKAIGDKVGYMGPIGAGTIAKLVHNMISIASRGLIAEGFTLGVKAGVKPEALLEAIRGASYGQGLMLSQMIPNVIFKGDFDSVRFALKLARKDIGLATELAREYDVPMPMAAIAEQTMMEALARGWGDKDSTSPWMLQEEAAGVKVRATP
jgi:3-hydroxyisobutyrate dehydrogenase